MNILLCLDDISWEYSRHACVTLLSLFETNSKHLFHIYIVSSHISERNQWEINNIVSSHWSAVFFIISPDIIPADIKDELIFSRQELTYATFYRLFFCEHIDTSQIERILCLDCDTLVRKDIRALYERDMWNNIIVGSRDTQWMEYLKKKTLWLKHYINAWVLLIDIQKYKKIDLKKNIQYINKYYKDVLKNDDQDYINLIFQDAIQIYPSNKMNCMIDRKYFIRYRDATILHLTNKAYLLSMPIPKEIRNLYFSYLNKTTFKDYPAKKTWADFWIALYSTIRSILILGCWYIFGSFGSYWAWKITKGPVDIYTRIVWK